MLFSCHNALRRIAFVTHGYPKCVKIVEVVLYITLGVVVFLTHNTQSCTRTVNVSANASGNSSVVQDISTTCDLTFIDALYLTISTISTVGYGDLSPSSRWMQAFAMVYILIGCSYVFALLSSIFTSVLESYRQLVLALIDRFDLTPETVGEDTTGDGRINRFRHVSQARRSI